MNPDGKSEKNPHPRVLIRILNALYENGELKKTRLAWASKMSYNALQFYLPILSRKRMITVTHSESGYEFVRITNTGIEAMKDISKWY